MICKSLICFCSGTPGGRVDVVNVMIGCVLVIIWAFCGGPPPPPFLFCCCFVCCCVVSLFVHHCWFFWFTRRPHEKWQEDKKKKVNIWTTFGNKKEANIPSQGILPQYGDPHWGWVRQDFKQFYYHPPYSVKISSRGWELIAHIGCLFCFVLTFSLSDPLLLLF
jgi:hypothetical protein